ncbi:ribonuclease H2 subunit A [Hyalella azteca]|uniref:Ribonuclease n=1 Tax=Hyalella azteca TaxID=294128 RepID=A0A8B7P8R6_HYAAZ|nr:ribonuclease H2 subunit A [Hyalella azteca]
MDLSEYNSNNFMNCHIDSAVPEVCKTEPCVLGVDEAGRGPVLGPMVYGICYCPVSRNEDLKVLGAADSKTLTEAQREKLFQSIHENNDYIGWSIEVISPTFISNCMYKRPKVSLNEVSHNSAITLIRRAMTAGANITQVFVDTVGPPEKYQAKLQEIFPTLDITVSKKADALYPSQGVSSVPGCVVCARVARDSALAAWQFPEGIEGGTWGSGYPGDAITKNFLQRTLDPVFGFPSLVRFSWSTAESILQTKGVPVTWAEEEEADKEKKNTPSVLQFFARQAGGGRMNGSEENGDGGRRGAAAAQRHFFFSDRCLQPLQCL